MGPDSAALWGRRRPKRARMDKKPPIPPARRDGFTAGGRPRVSVFIAPRLWSDAPGAGNLTLDRYPDLLQWPARVSALDWTASIDGGPASPLALAGNPANPPPSPAPFPPPPPG